MKKQQRRLLTCLCAGVLILAVSAGAAFGSANGYSTYKDALMTLMLEEENFTLAGQLTISLDDKAQVTMQADYQQDGVNASNHTVTVAADGTRDGYWDTYLDGVNTWFRDDSETYHEAQYTRTNTTILSYDQDDEMQNRLLTFAELAADTVMGDLKNNFVQVGKEDGNTLYQVKIAGSQVPSLVNAGLSLFAYTIAADQQDVMQTTFEDYDAAMYHYYETQTGETLSEDFKTHYSEGTDAAWYEANQAQLKKLYDVTDGWTLVYDNLLEQKGGGLVYVYPDGSYDYYATMQEYIAACPDSDWDDDLYYYIGQDMVLDEVACQFGVNEDGQLTSTQASVCFTTTDMDGGHHNLVIAGALQISNHGTTTVQPLDTGDRTKAG